MGGRGRGVEFGVLMAVDHFGLDCYYGVLGYRSGGGQDSFGGVGRRVAGVKGDEPRDL